MNTEPFFHFRRYKTSGTANGSTGNMNTHLDKKHAEKLDQPDEEDAAFVSGNLNEKYANISMILVSDLFARKFPKSATEVDGCM